MRGFLFLKILIAIFHVGMVLENNTSQSLNLI